MLTNTIRRKTHEQSGDRQRPPVARSSQPISVRSHIVLRGCESNHLGLKSFESNASRIRQGTKFKIEAFIFKSDYGTSVVIFRVPPLALSVCDKRKDRVLY